MQGAETRDLLERTHQFISGVVLILRRETVKNCHRFLGNNPLYLF
jgi:hypothetical protein